MALHGKSLQQPHICIHISTPAQHTGRSAAISRLFNHIIKSAERCFATRFDASEVQVGNYGRIADSIVGWGSSTGQWARIENKCVIGEDVHMKVSWPARTSLVLVALDSCGRLPSSGLCCSWAASAVGADCFCGTCSAMAVAVDPRSRQSEGWPLRSTDCPWPHAHGLLTGLAA